MPVTRRFFLFSGEAKDILDVHESDRAGREHPRCDVLRAESLLLGLRQFLAERVEQRRREPDHLHGAAGHETRRLRHARHGTGFVGINYTLIIVITTV